VKRGRSDLDLIRVPLIHRSEVRPIEVVLQWRNRLRGHILGEYIVPVRIA
jgi:hypothetical protein